LLPHAVEDETPLAADITFIEGRFVSLFVKPPGMPPRERRAVPHISDPAEKERTREARRQRGAWRFIPGHEYPQPGEVAQAAKMKELASAGGSYAGPSEKEALTAEERILNMTTDGLAPAQIAKELGEPWTHQKIGQVLSRLKKQTAASES
jgi:hypothetical protein